MAEKIIFDTDKSSRINRRVQEDGTLIKEADNVEFVINRNEDNIFTHSNKPGNSLFRIYPTMVWNHAIKATKCSFYINTKWLKFISRTMHQVKKIIWNFTRPNLTHKRLQTKTDNWSKSYRSNVLKCLSYYKCYCRRGKYLKCR